MNALSSLTIKKDTSLAFLRAAHRRGWRCFYFTLEDMFCKDGEAYALMHQLDGLEHADRLPESTAVGITALSDLDIILMRQDPPFNTEYIYATYALELAEKKGVLVANRPQSLRDFNEKMAILKVPACTVPTLVSRNFDYLRQFWIEHQAVIYKPLDGKGGGSIFYVGQDAANLNVILETLTENQQVSVMAQRYIPDILISGDKRVLLVNGEPIPYALARIPKHGEIRGNLAAGGHGVVVPLTARDYTLCEAISPMLQAHGLYFVGIDIIGDYITEINVTSPTCVLEIEAETGLDIAGQYMECLEALKNKT
jgi:glutathione synthase